MPVCFYRSMSTLSCHIRARLFRPSHLERIYTILSMSRFSASRSFNHGELLSWTWPNFNHTNNINIQHLNINSRFQRLTSPLEPKIQARPTRQMKGKRAFGANFTLISSKLVSNKRAGLYAWTTDRKIKIRTSAPLEFSLILTCNRRHGWGLRDTWFHFGTGITSKDVSLLRNYSTIDA